LRDTTIEERAGGLAMSRAPIDVVTDLYEARQKGDRIQMLAYCSPEMTFTFNIDPDRIGEGSTLIGWDAMHAHFANLKRNWDDLGGEVLNVSEDRHKPDQINALVSFKLRHRASGDVLKGKKRQEWIVRDGVITRMTEIFDAKAVHAFQRLAAFNTPPPADPYMPQPKTDA
jgi:ketosteroid isomerase-like protein